MKKNKQQGVGMNYTYGNASGSKSLSRHDQTLLSRSRGNAANLSQVEAAKKRKVGSDRVKGE